MNAITTSKVLFKGGEGYVFLAEDDVIPTSTAWRFIAHENRTTILFNDQASGVENYSIRGRRERKQVPYPMHDVVQAFQIASRGYTVDLKEFCDKLSAKRQPKPQELI